MVRHNKNLIKTDILIIGSGGHKAYAIAKVAKEVEVILISSLPRDKVCKLFFLPMQGI